MRVDGPEDGRPVLLLHGFPETSLSWAAVTPLLTEAGLRTYAPDQLGYSPGARPDEVDAYSTPSLAQVTADLMTALDVPRADVVGHDWGANVAWALAGWHPDRVRSLTAVSVPHPAAYTVAYRDRPGAEGAVGLHPAVLAAGQGRGGAARRRRAAASADAVRRRGRLGHPGGGGRGVRGGAVGAGGADRCAELVPGDELGPRVDAVEVPTTYVWSDADVAIGRTAAEACANYVTGDYRFVELPGITHWIPEQAPEQLAAAILDRVAST